MQAHHAQLQLKFYQRLYTDRKLPLQGTEGDEHADGHQIVDHLAGAQPQYDDQVAGLHEGVDPSKQHVYFGYLDIGVDGVDFKVEPVSDAAFRHAMHLDRGNTVQRPHKIRAGAGISHQCSGQVILATVL